MTAATCGLTAGIGIFMVVDGMASIGIGVALMITGLTTEPSEKTDKLRENLPTDILSIFTKSADIILENENNEIELNDTISYTSGEYDWRELIYQMALDYSKYNGIDDKY